MPPHPLIDATLSVFNCRQGQPVLSISPSPANMARIDMPYRNVR
jgi:hypothetical protein